MKMTKYFILIFLYVFILPVLTQRRWQRQEVQRCYTPDNSIGVCLTLSNCPSVANVYANNINNPQIVPYLQTLKRNCGNRVVGRDPVVCCQDAYRNQPRITTQPPPTRPTIGIQTAPPIQTTQIPTIAPTPGPETRANQNCWGPDTVPGICKELKNCPVYLNRLKANPKDATFADFLRKSNQICSNEYSSICCPLDENSGNNGNGNIELPPTWSPPTNTPNSNQFINRLPTVQDGCGRSNNTFRKIVGGVDARLGAWPWIALLGYGESERDNIEFKCGGSLITQRHVLTAAHCIRNDLQIVRLGEHDLRTDTETRHIDVPIARSERHPEYTRRDAYADIAILYLRNTVQFTDLIKPVCLPLTNDLRTKSYVDYSPFVVGWGRTQEGGKTASVLQELQIPVFENSVCVDSYSKKKRYFSERQFGNSVLCAGILAGGKDTCQGDSGGPLMIPENIDGRFYFFELGVVSYGIGCARPEVPGVYTSVQFYLDWIQQKVAATS